MAVFGAPSASKDAMVVSRRQDNSNVIRWRQRDVGTGVVTPVDLSGWSVRVTLCSPRGDVWLEYPAAKDADGYLLVGPSKAQLAGPEWAGRSLGSYAVTASKGGLTTCLVDAELRII